MTVLDISLVNMSLRASWKPLAIFSIAFVLIAIGFGDKAEAAVDFGSRPAQQAVEGPALGPWARALELRLDHSPIAPRVSDVGDLIHDVAADMPVSPAAISSGPVAWSILLAGLLGLFATAREPAAARFPPRRIAAGSSRFAA